VAEPPVTDQGPPVADQGPLAPPGAGRDAGSGWHRPLGHTPRIALSADTAQTPGMARLEGISGRLWGSEGLWMGETHLEAGVSSSDHHHGESETAIYVVSGHPAFVFVEDGKQRRIETAPGDYVYVPPWTPHREENPGGDEAVVVIARSTQEAIVVNLTGLS